MNYCGIDLASKTSAFCVMTEKCEVVFECESETDEDGFRQALHKHVGLRIVLETSPLAEWAATTLEALGHKAVVIDARKAKAVITTKKKTDVLDARNLARMAVTGWYSEVHRKSEDARLMRTYLKARDGVLKVRKQLVAQIRGLLRAHGIKVGEVSAGRFESRVRHLLGLKCAGMLPAITPLLSLLRSARANEAEMTRKLREMAKSNLQCRLLMTTPGVGELVACAFVSTIDDPSRFQRSDQVPAYIGLVPSIYQSGEVSYRGRTTKQGDALLRMMLVEAAQVILTRSQKSSDLKTWGQAIVKRKGHGKAKVAVARKLSMILYRMWVTQQAFVATA
jgi:transposase